MNIEQETADMIELQNKLNSEYLPNWKLVRSTTDFARAAWLEAAELVESTPWKWWKDKAEPDINNVKIETVDILHFLLSIIILSDNSRELTATLSSSLASIEAQEPAFESAQLQLICDSFVKNLLNQNYGEALANFASLINQTMSPRECIMLYKGKNILNKVRQDLGYKQGTYNKMINGKEDNQIMAELAQSATSAEQLEKQLIKALTKHDYAS